jgi:hypothetical protein
MGRHPFAARILSGPAMAVCVARFRHTGRPPLATYWLVKSRLNYFTRQRPRATSHERWHCLEDFYALE